MRLKPFFARGQFFGLDETAHVHTLKKEQRAVVNVFNLDSSARKIEVSLKPEEIGLAPSADIHVSGAEHRKHGSTHVLTFSLPARGAALAEIRTQRGG
jgi:hypothetical protein